MSTSSNAGHVQARLALVDEHIRCENRHDLEAVMATFGPEARYDDEPWNDHRPGVDGVRSYYTELLRAMPDLAIDVVRRHVASDTIVVEVVIRGTHLGPWRGLPATGRRLQLPLCGVYTFDAADRLAGERIYYDRASVLHQLGFFHEPVGGLGRLVTALSHPISTARAYLIRPRKPTMNSYLAIAAVVGALGVATVDAQPTPNIPTPPCSLLTPAEVGAALGFAVDAGTPLASAACMWKEAGKATGRKVALTFLTDRGFEVGKTPLAGTEKPEVSGVGNEAHYKYYVEPRYERIKVVSLDVKKGSVLFGVELWGLPLEEAKAKTKSFALAAVAKL